MNSKKQENAQENQKMNSSRKPAKAIRTKHQNQTFTPGIYITRQINQADVILIKQAFDHFDSNRMGILTPNDLKQALYNLNFYATEYDDQGLGGLTFDAFMRVIGSNPAQTETSNDLKKLFRKYDRENKGYISAQDLLLAAKSVGESMTEQESRKLFKALDQKNKGKIQFEEFCLLMHHPNSLE